MEYCVCTVQRVTAPNASGRFLCALHQSADTCGVCGEPAGAMRHATHMQSYSRFALCGSCTTALGQSGGDLLELAWSSTAHIVASAKLAQYATDLEMSVPLNATQRATLRRVLHSIALIALISESPVIIIIIPGYAASRI